MAIISCPYMTVAPIPNNSLITLSRAYELFGQTLFLALFLLFVIVHDPLPNICAA